MLKNIKKNIIFILFLATTFTSIFAKGPKPSFKQKIKTIEKILFKGEDGAILIINRKNNEKLIDCCLQEIGLVRFRLESTYDEKLESIYDEKGNKEVY